MAESVYVPSTLKEGYFADLPAPVAGDDGKPIVYDHATLSYIYGEISGGGVTDHGALTGLGDDDHPQYALLAGRTGGQTIRGGNAANDDLTLEGTSHATKTTSHVILQPNGGNVGIGTTNPSQKFEVVGISDIYSKLTTSGASGDVYQLFNNSGDGNNSWAIGRHNAGNFYINQSSTNYPSGSLNTRFAINASGNVGIGTTSPTALLDVNSNIFRLRTAKTPANAGDAGNQGDIGWDNNFIYVAVATNSWKRAALSSW